MRIWMRSVIFVILPVFICTAALSPVAAQNLPTRLSTPLLESSNILSVTPVYKPPLLAGMRIHPTDPFSMNFFVDHGDAERQEQDLEIETIKLVKYFLASLAIPDNELWVNLSPYEPERIISPSLGKTQMGQVMLAQDYLLKYLTASLMYPESETGKNFWEKIYQNNKLIQIEQPLNLFNKVWIIPQDVRVYIQDQNVFVSSYHLKVMLEEDYLAQQSHTGLSEIPADSKISQRQSGIVREHILPILEQEINQGQHFAPLRQVMNAMVLGKWYKDHLQNSFLGQTVAQKGKVESQTTSEDKKQVYQDYVKLFTKGAFDVLHEGYDPVHQKVTERRFLVGGISAVDDIEVFNIPDSLVTVDANNSYSMALINFDWLSKVKNFVTKQKDKEKPSFFSTEQAGKIEVRRNKNPVTNTSSDQSVQYVKNSAVGQNLIWLFFQSNRRAFLNIAISSIIAVFAVPAMEWIVQAKYESTINRELTFDESGNYRYGHLDGQSYLRDIEPSTSNWPRLHELFMERQSPENIQKIKDLLAKSGPKDFIDLTFDGFALSLIEKNEEIAFSIYRKPFIKYLEETFRRFEALNPDQRHNDINYARLAILKHRKYVTNLMTYEVSYVWRDVMEEWLENQSETTQLIAQELFNDADKLYGPNNWRSIDETYTSKLMLKHIYSSYRTENLINMINDWSFRVTVFFVSLFLINRPTIGSILKLKDSLMRYNRKLWIELRAYKELMNSQSIHYSKNLFTIVDPYDPKFLEEATESSLFSRGLQSIIENFLTPYYIDLISEPKADLFTYVQTISRPNAISDEKILSALYILSYYDQYSGNINIINVSKRLRTIIGLLLAKEKEYIPFLLQALLFWRLHQKDKSLWPSDEQFKKFLTSDAVKDIIKNNHDIRFFIEQDLNLEIFNEANISQYLHSELIKNYHPDKYLQSFDQDSFMGMFIGVPFGMSKKLLRNIRQYYKYLSYTIRQYYKYRLDIVKFFIAKKKLPMFFIVSFLGGVVTNLMGFKSSSRFFGLYFLYFFVAMKTLLDEMLLAHKEIDQIKEKVSYLNDEILLRFFKNYIEEQNFKDRPSLIKHIQKINIAINDEWDNLNAKQSKDTNYYKLLLFRYTLTNLFFYYIYDNRDIFEIFELEDNLEKLESYKKRIWRVFNFAESREKLTIQDAVENLSHITELQTAFFDFLNKAMRQNNIEKLNSAYENSNQIIPGGIDLSSENYTIEIQGQLENIKFPIVSPQLLENIQFDFLNPVLKSFEPVNIPLLLGLKTNLDESISVKLTKAEASD